MLSINTNVGALTAAQHSYSVNKSMETSMERLASGKRVNGAADDAAGLAIANRITSEIQGLQKSIQNAADAQAMLGVAEGALEEVNSILLRMRELAIQGATDTLRPQDQDMLQLEVTALEAEIQRISDDTMFAGLSLLGGGFASGATFQIGPRASDTIQISFGAINATTAVNANNAGGLALAGTVSTQSGSQTYITTISNAISVIAEDRARYGAVMNRLQYTMDNLRNVSMNQQQSRSRIQDADYAKETSELARTQIIQQAATAMLSQANTLQQTVLQLLQQ